MLERILVWSSLFVLSVGAVMGAAQGPTEAPPALIDINSASLEELQSVFADEMLAREVIQGRPYANKRQLLTRDLVSEDEYERIKDRIVARRSTAPQ
jgi:DNA uptake protein ComE-like DNA-binding protein